MDENSAYETVEADFMLDLGEILEIARSALTETVDTDVDVCIELKNELRDAYKNAYIAYRYELIEDEDGIHAQLLASAFFTLGMKMAEWVRTSAHVEGLQEKIETTLNKNRDKGAGSTFRDHENVILEVLEKYLNSSKRAKFTQSKAIAEIEERTKMTVPQSTFNHHLKIFKMTSGKSIFTTTIKS